jgi:hypothetical protein
MKGIFCFVLALSFANFLSAQTELVNQNRPLPNLGKKFTVVAHIVLDSLKKPAIDSNDVKSTIKKLDAFFAPIGVSFEVCKINRIPNYSFYVLKSAKDYREMLNQYHVSNRINMFFVDTYPSGEPMGYADSLGIASLTDKGIVVNSKGISEKKVAHLMGHYFGLMHTFAGTTKELVKRTNCATAGDRLCDTPADPFELGEPLDDYLDLQYPCRFINKQRDAQGEYYTPDVGNFMSYYFPCHCSFSREQLELMAKNYLLTSPKMW